MKENKYIFQREKLYGLTWMPAIMVGFDVLRSFISTGIGTLQMLLMAGFCVYMTYMQFTKAFKFNPVLYLFFVYIILLALFTTNYERTSKNILWVFISMSLMPIGYVYIRNMTQFRQLMLSTFWVFILFSLNGLITSILGIGENPYGGSLSLGSFVYTVLFSGSIAIFMIPLIYPFTQTFFVRLVLSSTALLTIVFLVLSMRRTAILIPVLGYLIYFFMSSYKKQMTKTILLVVAVLVISFPLYSNLFMTQMAARENKFSSGYSLEEEARWGETQAVIRERWLDDVSWFRTLFGKEVFNSNGKYAGGYYGMRYLHIDYNTLIWSTGLIGTLLYLSIYGTMIYRLIEYGKYVPRIRYFWEMKYIFITLIVLSLLISAQGGMFTIAFRGMIFLYCGAILGIFRRFYDRGYLNSVMRFKD